ncbi:MAG: ABC transporter ATP-binding protein [Spirochaetota bacterium]|nr:MAG: ABC transporter ATP-binding protein [Spirochaetota bacterium]
MGTKLLEIKDLKVHFDVYGGTLKVLNGVNLKMDEGEKVGLVGETGCGKTTTAKSILKILPIPPGRIIGGEALFKGNDILRMRESDIREIHAHEISMIFQDPTASLNPVFTIGTQLIEAIKYSNLREGLSKKEKKARAIQALKDVALPDPERILENYPIQLSGGMRQRICIAMALAARSKLLIADEPTTSLDVTIQDQVLRLLGALVKEKDTSTIFITHSLGIVREWTQRVYVMYAGGMVETARTDDLFDSPLHPYTQGLMNAIPKLTGEGIALGIEGRIPDYLNPPTGCRFHTRCQHVMDVCKKKQPPFFLTGKDHQVACYLYKE